jgi:hypothetical protein
MWVKTLKQRPSDASRYAIFRTKQNRPVRPCFHRRPGDFQGHSGQHSQLRTRLNHRRGVGGGVGFPGGGRTGPGRGRGRGLGGGWGRGKVTNPGSPPSLPLLSVTRAPSAGLRGVGGGVGTPGGGWTGPGRGRGRGLGGGWGRGKVMMAGFPPMSTRISTVSALIELPLGGFCAA